MEDLDKLVKNLVTQTSFGNKREDTSKRWTKQTEKLTAGLFQRMATLYRAKANDYKILNGNELTEDFKLWCWKLDHLTPEQFKQGVELMEQQERDARRTGDESWPPSYAGFIGLATMQTGARPGTYKKLPPPQLTKAERAEMMQKLRDEIEL